MPYMFVKKDVEMAIGENLIKLYIVFSFTYSTISLDSL